MAQVWECMAGCGSTTDPKAAGDHERNNPQRDENGHLIHYMDDIGE